VADVNDLLETAVGGKVATEVFEGERRFPGVRLPEAYRNNIEAISNLLITSPGGAQAAGRRGQCHRVDGPAQISREMGKRRIVIGMNVKGRDLGGFVAELQQKVDAQIKLPEGYYLEWGGQFQNMERALGHLMIIVPITVAAIFFLLFVLFNSLRLASLIILVLPFASIGGIVGLAVTGNICRCRPRWALSRCGALRCSMAWCWSPISATCVTRANQCARRWFRGQPCVFAR
jgi:cobalt-zinc-cadmium resistance protein CzcA